MNMHPQYPPLSKVSVRTSARLHLGFFDLNGEINRRFGSLGLSLAAPIAEIEIALASHEPRSPALPAYIEKSKQLLLNHASITDAIDIHIHHQIPRHFGLGSGTQMALAVGAGINRLFDLNLSVSDIATIVGRGQRSGVGVGTFATGGLVIDGGRGADTRIPPIIARHAFPEDWRILLIFDHAHVGVHGLKEQQAFATLASQNLRATEKISHQILMQALPALIEQDIQAFSAAIANLQAYTSDYFAPAQGGPYASARIADVLQYLQSRNVTGVGQSSWGPTGFALFASEIEAMQHLTQLQSQFTDSQLAWLICHANNNGAEIQAI